MERRTELELTRELLGLAQSKRAWLDESVSGNPVSHYISDERFAAEQEHLFRALPHPVVHSSELPEPGSFLRRTVAGLPLLFTRDKNGVAHAWLNVCRHRGTRLVDDHSGCKHRFSCPYHAWTWNSQGELIGVPHEAQGFPDMDRSKMGLKRVGCREAYGWLWVQANTEDAPGIDEALAGLAPDFDWFGASDLTLQHSTERLGRANWKILVEGGIEAYHFRVAHRKTIAPYFFDNLSTYRSFGTHLRSVLAKKSLAELGQQPEESWRLREHSQVLYTLFPMNMLLVQSDHVAWIQLEPLSANETRIRVNTLVPADRIETPEDLTHWQKNHDITVTTLDEDFDIGESIQSGLASGANESLTFGRFEGALACFNQSIEQVLSSQSAKT
ncbi:phenylpropionate dioxygenase-like ring-hydroxylating dioxygenase large terminal subunit [Litorivivens lipolytica]|uniref:Phenylpropionate dioxygenase-like ring-hydroxylating dioxygenase large terminal subunit n=1 Tax=Litorivivens lipolytica TaxID=1524264 RepID=A0A7W4Z5T9_9GAMM|nr:SRPBCC family protein [Litorivivens lipolytica]MBB3047854.1 phenylpropionate dioxygenase-like ring-hydroxylating dioxygenase large terminal subunit [Litorivivens lipolytica]